MSAGGINVPTYYANSDLANWLRNNHNLWVAVSNVDGGKNVSKGDIIFWNSVKPNTDLTVPGNKTNFIDHVVLVTSATTYTQWNPQRNDKDISWFKDGMSTSDGTKYLMAVHFISAPQPPTPGTLQLSQGLSLSTTSPTRNQSITASFKVKNVGDSAMTLQTLSAGARRGTDWNGVNVDFPAVANITLQAGQEYIYQQSRPFDTTGAYFTEPVVQISGQWGGISGSNGGFSRVTFNVGVTPPPDYRFLGNPSSTLKDNGGSADLTVCADNITNRTVNVNFRRPDGVKNGQQQWKVWTQSKKATSRCVTFKDLDGAGPLSGNTLYESRAALDQQPNMAWSNTSCYAGNSQQQGLCDTVRKNNQK